jgi:hypothetical protein
LRAACSVRSESILSLADKGASPLALAVTLARETATTEPERQRRVQLVSQLPLWPSADRSVITARANADESAVKAKQGP